MTFSSLVIIDLGIARVWRDGADADTVKFGTRSYAPPEQFGFGQTSVRSDIYALGALLFFCLTGTDPKPGPEYARAMRGPRRSRPACRCYLHGEGARSGQALCECGSVGTGDACGIRSESPRAASCACLHPDLGDGVDAPRAPEPPGIPRPAASAACSLLSRVPESLGRIWNTLVCFSLLVFFAGSHFAVFHPTGANQSYPTLLLIIEYFLFVDGLMVLMHFALLDTRRLRRRFALLDSYRGKKLAKLWLKALGVLLLCMIVIVAVANAAGVVDTSAT